MIDIAVKPIHQFQPHNGRIWSLAFSPDGNLLASASTDRSVRIYKTSDYSLQQTLDGEHDKTIRSVAFSPNGKFLAAASFDATVSLYILSEGVFEFFQKLEGHENEVGWNLILCLGEMRCMELR
jgi:WD40 repeat protein